MVMALVAASFLLACIGTGAAVDDASTCCAMCLAQPHVGSADALDFNACSAAQTTCCFDQTCQPALFGTPTIDLSLVTFAGPDMLFPSGNWLSIQWPAATDVKTMSLKTGQVKATQVTNASVSAAVKSGVFFVCPTLPGTLFFRGFGSGGCTASKELYINITAGNGTSCSDTLPSAPSSSGTCDPVRGVLQNGVCSCLQDYIDPPQCANYSFWKKWGQIVTYLAGGLSCLTALFGLYRFWKMRKGKEATIEAMMPTPEHHESPKDPPPHAKLMTPATELPVQQVRLAQLAKTDMAPKSTAVTWTKLRATTMERPRSASNMRSSQSSVSSEAGVVVLGFPHDHDERTSNEFTL
ncbi:Aste57867_1580 [Aphanomyces stellatus]|uniref:Aste57867_1580 protein n=1 Tax=Aphanomyces stellatus TaxID=120398 RepID=A0A485K5L7_9STRA|nr:hypothetical protein As57867_001579 [Aphanomyces stellatus]VFT78793.1 Aste57867_1580 [Aphanomyces stellatus]